MCKSGGILFLPVKNALNRLKKIGSRAHHTVATRHKEFIPFPEDKPYPADVPKPEPLS